MKRTLILVYGLVCYAMFFAVFLYSIGFVGNYLVPKSIDSLPEGAQAASFVFAFVLNVALLGLFGVQHSLMARPQFKRIWTKIVPLPAERATYVLATNLCLILLYVLWRPMLGVVWDATGTALEWPLVVLYFAGWGLVFYATILIDHFDLFGVRQVVLYFRKKEYTHHPFQTPSLYKYMRHPLYLGWFMVFWLTPHMTVGHLVFAMVTTAYIVVATVIEERDLVVHFGEVYRHYKKSTPRYFPIPGRKSASTPPAETTAR